MGEDISVVKDRVQTYLRELVGTYEVDAEGDYSFRHGSSRIHIRVRPSGEHFVVRIWAITNRQVPASPELFKHLATNNEFLFGNFNAVEKDDGVTVTFGHTLLGDFLDPEELKMAVALLARTADAVDNEIRDTFGGQVVHSD